jgi:hypothetical protein
MNQLDKAERQLARIGENKTLNVNNTREVFRTRSVQLMTVVIKFFDSALRYFAYGPFRTT